MKLIILGDTHGRNVWEKIVKQNDFDKIIFLGDYFDTYDDITIEQQINTFNKIVEFKKQNIDNVILLLGNHDYHYLKGVNESYSGYSRTGVINISPLLEKAIRDKLIQVCYFYNDILFSHAGITNTWYKNTFNEEFDPEINFIEKINNLLIDNRIAFNFTIGINFSMFGDDICQSPIWVRPHSLFDDRLYNYKQVVGHTQMEKIEFNEQNIVFIDTLGNDIQEFLIIDNNEFLIGNIK